MGRNIERRKQSFRDQIFEKSAVGLKALDSHDRSVAKADLRTYGLSGRHSRHSRKLPRCAAEPSVHIQVFRMLRFSKDCFFRIYGRPKFHLSPNRWRSVMQVLFNSRHPQATQFRDLTERRVRFVLRRLG